MDYVTRDGVRLAYVEAGRGPKSMLLVHGMQCNHTHMLEQLRYFSRTHRVVAVDMRGHGESDKPHSSYNNREFNDDLIVLCEALGLRKPVAVGHSFGGSTLLHLTEHHPDFLGGLVILDSGIRTLANKVGELGVVSELTQAQRRRFLGDRLFGRDDPQALKDRILDEMLAVPDHVASKMRETVLGFDGGAAAAKCRIPALFLLADRPFTDAETLSTLGPNWRVGQVVGAGHFIQMIAAEQVNAMIDRFLKLSGL
jgi:pimeloyl-ACP methyl ester carboxylesterase